MSRGRQIVRQWMILRALERSRRGLSVGELGDVVDESCSPRTLYRDLQHLQAAGFPLTGSDGRWRMLGAEEGAWVVPFEPTQLLSLTISQDLFAPVEGTHLAEPLRELRSRLRAMLTPQGRAYCEELRRTAVATLFGPGDYTGRRAQLDAIQDAITREHRLRITYQPPRREAAERTIEPYCIWYASGRAYLIAFCRKADDIRTFAVQRVQSAEVLDEPFEPDPAFDPAAFARSGFGVYHGSSYRFEVDFGPEIAHLLRERTYHHSQHVTDLDDGGVRMTMTAAGLPEIASWVAGFGGQARPRQPPELVEAVETIHREGLERLTSDDTRSW